VKVLINIIILGDEMNSNNENILISQLLTRNLVSINENKTTYNAIKLLTTNNIGALPVLNDNMELSGIISERDIIREISNNLSVNFKKSNIKSIMTSKVITINKNTKSETIMDIMSKNKIRHIPIVENKLLIGIVSIGDVVKRLLEKFNLENQHLKSWLY
jgi:CBS domain-containing protein